MSKLKEKGITLLSLIVTVVILLILVGVTIGQITGNKGLFNRVRKTVSQYENTQEQEDACMLELETMLAEERENSKELEEPTANPEDVLLGKSYYDKNKEPQEGAMTNNGAINEIIEPGKTYEIPKGYHNGKGTVTANLADEVKSGALAYYCLCHNFARSTSWTDLTQFTSADLFSTTYTDMAEVKTIDTEYLQQAGSKNQMIMKVLKSADYIICSEFISTVPTYSQLLINGGLKQEGVIVYNGTRNAWRRIFWKGHLNVGDVINFKGRENDAGYSTDMIVMIFVNE